MDNVELHRLAHACGTLAEIVRQSINDFRVRQPTDRQRTAQALLAAGADHGVSLNILLSRPSPSAVFSGAALFRMQLDAVSRGVFFASPKYSTDGNVEDFLTNDRMPLVKEPGKRPRQIRLEELIEKMRDFLAASQPALAEAGLHERFRYGLETFNGLVHGGSEVVHAYQEHERFGLIFHPDFSALANVALHSATLCLVAEMTQIFIVAGHKQATFENTERRVAAYKAYLEAGKQFRNLRES